MMNTAGRKGRGKEQKYKKISSIELTEQTSRNDDDKEGEVFDEDYDVERLDDESGFVISGKYLQSCILFLLVVILSVIIMIMPTIQAMSCEEVTSLRSRTVQCHNKRNLTLSFDEWLQQQDHQIPSIDLCDPKFLPPRQTLNYSKPIQVFILLGQSNMLGMGTTYDLQNKMSLEYVVREEKRYQHLNIWDDAINDNSNINDLRKKKMRLDVRYVAVNQNFNVYANDWLQIPPDPTANDNDSQHQRQLQKHQQRRRRLQEQQHHHRDHHSNRNSRHQNEKRRLDPKAVFGIELQFGYIMGEVLEDSPVLLIKSCIGNRALGWDLLPPTVTSRYNDTGNQYTYPAYGEYPEHWHADEPRPQPDKFPWYAGKEYDTDIQNVQKILDNIGDYYPGLVTPGPDYQPNYEIAGYVWWQGQRDTRYQGHADQYESNLVKLIDSLRNDFASYSNGSAAKFLLATIGFGGYNMTEFTKWVQETAALDVNEVGSGSPYLQRVYDSQIALNDCTKYPQYRKTVHAVDIRSSFRLQPFTAKGTASNWNWPHYSNDARVYMEVSSRL